MVRTSKRPSRSPSLRAKPRASAAPPRKSNPANRRKRIVVADDDPTVAKLLIRMLQAAYDVEWASDGPGALALASRDPPPDLLMLDVMMPGFDGFGVAERIKLVPHARRVPILFITARDTPEDIVHGIQLGARGYIVKPFGVKELLAKVKKLVGE